MPRTDEPGRLEAPATQPAPELAPIPEGVLCPECGYDLRHLTGPRCPECGFELEIVRAQEPQLPWSRRREIGWFRAYWKTVWLVGRHPRRWCLEAVRPVSYRDSQIFRWITWLHAYLPIPIIIIFAVEALLGADEDPGLDEAFWWFFCTVQVFAALFLAALPGLASYSCHSRRVPVEQVNRAIALSYYAWAPFGALALIVPLYFVALVGGALAEKAGVSDGFKLAGVLTVFVALILHVVAFALVGGKLDLLAKRVLQRSGAARLWQFVWLGAAMVGVGLLILLLPLSVFYVLVVIHSFA